MLQLKNWTTEISPKQALLVILLANKKDFPNLLRYRPLLLQGIALKRITKAIELDMEIEVIEVENFHGVSRVRRGVRGNTGNGHLYMSITSLPT